VRGLDGLRALAVSAVVLFHATEDWLRGGFLGVDVFFVLSGYLITSQLLGEWESTGRINLAGFWKRRARRILAALYLLLAVTLTFALYVHPAEVAVFRGDAVATLAYVANWYFIFHHQPYFEAVAHPSPLLHLWSLGVEEQFYLVWPLLLAPALALLRRYAALPVLLLAVVSTVLMAVLYHPEIDPSRVYYGTDTHAAALLLGAVLAFVWAPRPEAEDDAASPRTAGVSLRLRGRTSLRRGLLFDVLGMASLLTLFAFFSRANDSSAFLYRGGFTVVALITGAAVVAVSHPAARLVTAVLELAPVRWLGRRSYAVYLWHWPVIVFTRPGTDVKAGGLWLLVLRVGLALAFAELSYRLVEQPVQRGLLGRIGRRIEEAVWSRQWRWLAASWIVAAAAAGLVSGLAFAVASAKDPAPPSYLAVTSVDTIRRPSPQLTSAGTPGGDPASGTETAQALDPAGAPPGPDAAQTPAADSSDAPDQPPAADAAAPAPPATPVSAGRVIAIGDSVMLGAVPQLTQDIDGIEVNAAVSRQVAAEIQLMSQLRDQSELGDVVIVDLGSNGTFTSGEFDQIMSVLSEVPRVVFVNVKVPRSWEPGNNEVIADGVRRYLSSRLVDWYDASVSHPEYFQVDEYHLQPDGAAAFAALITAGVTGP